MFVGMFVSQPVVLKWFNGVDHASEGTFSSKMTSLKPSYEYN